MDKRTKANIALGLLLLLLPGFLIYAIFFHQDLHTASREGDLQTVMEMVEAGKDIDVQDRGGNTPLMVAISYGHINVVEYLLENGAQVNHRAVYQWTPLMEAVSNRRIQMVKLLLEYGADPSAINNDGNTALDIAVEKNDEAIVQLLEN